MAGELIRRPHRDDDEPKSLIHRPNQEIEPKMERDGPPQFANMLPPNPFGAPGQPAPGVQNIFMAEQQKTIVMDYIIEELSRPAVMLMWGGVAIGIYLSDWWMVPAGFIKIALTIFAGLFGTAPHARKYLLYIAAAALIAAFGAAVVRPPQTTTPVAAPAPVVSQAPAKAPEKAKTRKPAPVKEPQWPLNQAK